ncbi:MAG: type IV toxin-antitoxin system AbiEi family antitoxin domain-containing protein [Caulobacterales bacterium]|jgi:hypothetical protein
MATNSPQKLKRILEDWTPRTVVTHPWLQARGVSRDLSRDYVKNGWLERLGAGTFKRPRETVTWQGALHSLQAQIDLRVHVGALTALAAEGAAHYVRVGEERVFLFAETGVTLPKWFREHSWPAPIKLTQSSLLPPGLGLRPADLGGFLLHTSAPERAILEALHLAPTDIDLVELAEVIDGLRTLRPKLMQALLEACASFKVKRLFLFLSTRAALPVVRHLNRDFISLGRGDRTIAPGGAYIAEFGLVVPKELASR